MTDRAMERDNPFYGIPGEFPPAMPGMVTPPTMPAVGLPMIMVLLVFALA